MLKTVNGVYVKISDEAGHVIEVIQIQYNLQSNETILLWKNHCGPNRQLHIKKEQKNDTSSSENITKQNEE